MARPLTPEIAYATLFAVLLPVCLVAWARAVAPLVHAPALHAPLAGGLLAALGGALILGGWAALWRFGGGLPMNAFPPPRFVTSGVYRIVPHPIYAGFVTACFGVSIATGSASGLWIVSPAALLGCVALVAGYESIDLRERFGDASTRSFLALPRAEPSRPSRAERLAAFAMTVLPSVALCASLARVVPPDACDSHFAFEARWPVWQESEIVFASTYAFVGFAPFAAASRRDLRVLVTRALLAMAIVFPVYLALPLVSPHRSFTPHGPLGAWLMQERAWSAATCAFPSFRVVWAFIAADAWASRASRARFAWRTWALLIALSCLTTGMQSLADVLGGLAVFALVARAADVWRTLRLLSERVANSWWEARLGPVRVINHGAWAALGAFGGVALLGMLVGRDHLAAILVCATAGLVGAALWAQYIEGSPSLSRPYGFYGGVLGIILGALFAPLLGTPVWLLLGAYTIVGPWVQGTGRLRCLVQGCCHGREAPPSTGIRYSHPRSRVVRLANLADVPVHPTPLYSILWNVVTAVILVRLWSLHAATNLVAGLYLILNGLGRFVEEAYRGEPQTPIFARLRVYQWVALASVVGGALVTALGKADPAPVIAPNAASVIAALVFGAVTGFALGVDFPESRARFSRLA